MILMRAVTALFCIFVAVPLLWLVYAAFLPAEAIITANLSTFGFSLANFAELPDSGLWRAMGVSFLATGSAVAGQVIFGLGAAYAIRNGLRIQGLVLALLALPGELLLVPLYRQFNDMALLGTLWTLILPFLASPLVTFLLIQAIRRLPWEVVEAARLDGASESRIAARIIAPMVRPEMVATAVLAFASHWNLVLYPRVMTGSSLWTVQAYLVELLRTRPFDWGLLGAAALVASLPIIVLFVIFEKRIIQVFESGFR